MKRFAAVLAFALILTAYPAFASTFGPVHPTAEPGRFAIGLGVFQYTGNLEFDDGNFTDDEIRQTRFFLQSSYGLANGYEIYGRVGGSDLEYEDGFAGQDTLDADAALFGSIGLKGPIHVARSFDLGFFAEGSLYSGYEEDMSFGSTNVEIEFDPSWEANIGLTFQKEIEGAYLYGGPVLYYRDGDADLTVKDPTAPADPSLNFKTSDSYNEENFLGAFLGVRWALKNGVKIDLEGQFKSEASVGATVSYSFR